MCHACNCILNINMQSVHQCDLHGYQLDKLLAFLVTLYYIVNKINQSINIWMCQKNDRSIHFNHITVQESLILIVGYKGVAI